MENIQLKHSEAERGRKRQKTVKDKNMNREQGQQIENSNKYG